MFSLVGIAIVIGTLIIISLAGYATFLLLKLKKQNKHIAEQRDAYNTKQIRSIVIISDAMKQEQCELSEGCWRLSVLMDSLDIEGIDFNQQYPSIFELYRRINHMPILDARKQLSKKERAQQDIQRMRHEAELADFIDKEVIELHSWAIKNN